MFSIVQLDPQRGPTLLVFDFNEFESTPSELNLQFSLANGF